MIHEMTHVDRPTFCRVSIPILIDELVIKLLEFIIEEQGLGRSPTPPFLTLPSLDLFSIAGNHVPTYILLPLR